MWSVGIYDLKLTDEQFWNLTPAKFYALCERKKQDMYRLDYRSGIIVSTIGNVNRSPNTPIFTPQQFMLSEALNKEEESPSPESLMAKFEVLAGVKRNGIQ